MKKSVVLSLFIISLFGVACSSEKENGKSEIEKPINITKAEPKVTPTVQQEVEQKTPVNTPASQVALDFINAYATHCDSANKAMDTKKWVEINQLTTPNFKKTYKNIVDEAFKEDPELGLDADPIFDAQDYPDEGFVLHKNDETGYVTLQGKDWPEFQLVVKVIQVNNNWLVEGAGIINVPEGKRINRF